jgi:hypothetical protein
MAACRGPCGGKESSGQGFTIRSTNAIRNAPDPALVHLTTVTGRRPTPAHYSHPDPMDHSQWYACTCTCIVATLVCIVPITHASPNFQKSLGQSAWPLPCRVRMESNARDSEVERSHLMEETPTTFSPVLPLLSANKFSPSPRLHVCPAAQCNTTSEMGLVGTDNPSAT